MTTFADKLAELQALLELEYLREADPRSWPGAGKGPAERSKQERGDRVWCKTDAAKTLTLISGGIAVQLRQLELERRQRIQWDETEPPLPPVTDGTPEPSEADLQAQIDADSERLAGEMIARLKASAGIT